MPDGVTMNVGGGGSLAISTLNHNGFSGTFVKSGDGALTVDKLTYCNAEVQGGTFTLAPGNAQNNAFIYGLTIANGATVNLNDAQIRTNGLYSSGTPGTLNIGAGGVLTTGEFNGYEYFGDITGGGSVVCGYQEAFGGSPPALPSGGTWSGNVSYTGSTTVTYGNTLVLNTSLATTSAINVNLASNIQVGAGAGNNRVIKTSSLSVESGSKINLTDNKMIVAGGTLRSWNGSAYTGVTGLVQSGRGDGTWNGSGIVTSMTDATTGVLTTLAVASAEELGNIGGTFAGQTINAGDTLVMYTWGGDADLNGELNGDDYFFIDSNAVNNGAVFGYHQGDFDYNGTIDGDDYFIIDSNITFAQASPPFPTGAGGGALAAVPEPASLAMLALFAAGMTARRRRN